MSKTVQDLFNNERDKWLQEARKAAHKLLKTRETITIEDVLEVCPRPQYIHKNTTGKVFNREEFIAVSHTKSKRLSMKGRWILVWKERSRNDNNTSTKA